MFKNLEKYTALTMGGILDAMVFKAAYFTKIIGNLIYLIIIYFLWKAIYASSLSGVVNGMTFQDTMVYLVLASAMFGVMDVYLVWWMGEDMKSGDLVIRMTKPIAFGAHMFFFLSGGMIVSFISTFIPTFIVVCVLTWGTIQIGYNLFFFFISLIFGLLINYMIDFLFGIICIFTHSVWGINTMKEVTVKFLSGATIPLVFFPEAMQKILECLPFQAIYHIPLNMLINKEMHIMDYLMNLGIQGIWVLVLFAIGILCWRMSAKWITVNGG